MDKTPEIPGKTGVSSQCWTKPFQKTQRKQGQKSMDTEQQTRITAALERIAAALERITERLDESNDRLKDIREGIGIVSMVIETYPGG
jgi:hypothetical protein